LDFGILHVFQLSTPNLKHIVQKTSDCGTAQVLDFWVRDAQPVQTTIARSFTAEGSREMG
jgi:hypothetical protein